MFFVQAFNFLGTKEEVRFEPDTSVTFNKKAWLVPVPNRVLNAPANHSVNKEFIRRLGRSLVDGLATVGTPAQIVETIVGSRFTRYCLEPLYKNVNGIRVKVSTSDFNLIEKDLLAILGLQKINIEAPALGKSYVAVDIENPELKNIELLTILSEEKYQKGQHPLSIVLGRDMGDNPVWVDLSLSPNLLIGGVANSGKSTCLSGIITNLAIANTPNEINLILIDTRKIEFTSFIGIPHLISLISEYSVALSAFRWLHKEAQERMMLFKKYNARNIDDYNRLVEFEEQIPFIVVIVSDLADILTQPSIEIEKMISQIVGLARSSGIHLILSTYRPSSEILTPLITSNISTRIALKTSSELDSYNLINHSGAEKLSGQGDMLLLFYGKHNPLRIQGVSVTDEEIERVVEFWKSQV